ncbi:hypothetical protein ACHAXT_000414 [Thalassiosira profunda]
MGGTEAKEDPHDARGPSPFAEAEEFLQKLNFIVVDGSGGDDALLDAKECSNHFESLLFLLKGASSREAGLVEKCKELQTQNAATSTELQTATRAHRSAESQVETLQQDVDMLKDLLEHSNTREDQAKERLGQLQDELERLTDLVDKNEIAMARKDGEAKQLASDVEEWKGQASAKTNKINALEIERQQTTRALQQLRASYAELNDDNASLKERIAEKNDDLQRGNERRERVESELEEVQSKLQAKTKAFVDLEHTKDVESSKVAMLDKQLSDAKKAIASKEQELKDEASRISVVAAALNDQKKLTADVSQQLAESVVLQKRSAIDNARLMSEKTQLERNVETERRAILRLQQQVEDAKAATRLSNDEAQLANKELETMRRRENQLNRELQASKRENAVATGRLKVSEDKIKSSIEQKRSNDQVIASLEKELIESKDAALKQELITRRLEGECDGLRLQSKDSQATCERLANEIKVRDNRQLELRSQIDAQQSQLEEQQKLHDALRLDQNHSLKDLADARREIRAFEQEKKASQRLVDSLREEITTKDSALVKENYEYRQQKSQKEIYVDEIARLKRSLGENEVLIRTQLSESRRLGVTISKLENEVSGQKRELDHVIDERDVLGTQLIRRNDEIVLLSEKITMLQNKQTRGETQYSSRLDDIRILKLKLKDLQRQLTISQGGQGGVEDLSRSLFLVKKELLRERLKVKALSDELENPLNVHRWRKLEGTDPQAYEMIQKNQILQRRLLDKSEEAAAANNVIRDLEEKQRDLETELSRRPGPEIAQQLNKCQHDVRIKDKQLRALQAELRLVR